MATVWYEVEMVHVHAWRLTRQVIYYEYTAGRKKRSIEPEEFIGNSTEEASLELTASGDFEKRMVGYIPPVSHPRASYHSV